MEYMKKYIKSISGIVPNTFKDIDILLEGRNLILTGVNGSGKTSLLKEIYRKIDLLITQKKLADLPTIEKNLLNQENYIKTLHKGMTQYSASNNQIKILKGQIKDIKEGLKFNISNVIKFSESVEEKKSLILFFQAERRSTIRHADTAKGVVSEMEKYKQPSNPKISLGSNLEQHLLNLKNRRSLAISEDNDLVLANKIEQWFHSFSKSIKLLMEDKTTELKFNSDTLKFSIKQAGKPLYTFQNLSSGYTAIFDIYAELLMHTEYFEVIPERLEGVVLIDEIDVHLHVSLQRLVLPFFERSFPKIQFIVTTHSPFVLSSVKYSIIFDVSRNQQIDEDLSMYPHTAIMEGLLGTKSTSILLDDMINELSILLRKESKEYNKIKKIVMEIKPYQDKLDAQSKAFYLLALNTLLDEKE